MTSPGFLINLHVALVRYNDLQQTLTQELKDLPTLCNILEINQWIEKYHLDCKDMELPVPKFTIHTTTHKFGNGTHQVCYFSLYK